MKTRNNSRGWFGHWIPPTRRRMQLLDGLVVSACIYPVVLIDLFQAIGLPIDPERTAIAILVGVAMWLVMALWFVARIGRVAIDAGRDSDLSRLPSIVSWLSCMGPDTTERALDLLTAILRTEAEGAVGATAVPREALWAILDHPQIGRHPDLARLALAFLERDLQQADLISIARFASMCATIPCAKQAERIKAVLISDFHAAEQHQFALRPASGPSGDLLTPTARAKAGLLDIVPAEPVRPASSDINVKAPSNADQGSARRGVSTFDIK